MIIKIDEIKFQFFLFGMTFPVFRCMDIRVKGIRVKSIQVNKHSGY